MTSQTSAFEKSGAGWGSPGKIDSTRFGGTKGGEGCDETSGDSKLGVN